MNVMHVGYFMKQDITKWKEEEEKNQGKLIEKRTKSENESVKEATKKRNKHIDGDKKRVSGDMIRCWFGYRFQIINLIKRYSTNKIHVIFEAPFFFSSPLLLFAIASDLVVLHIDIAQLKMVSENVEHERNALLSVSSAIHARSVWIFLVCFSDAHKPKMFALYGYFRTIFIRFSYMISGLSLPPLLIIHHPRVIAPDQRKKKKKNKNKRFFTSMLILVEEDVKKVD